MVETRERLDNCGSDVYEFISDYFSVKGSNKDIRTAKDLVSILNSSGLRFLIHIPWFYYINPSWMSLGNTCLRKSEFKKFINNNEGVLVHYATCKQLYGLDDSWLHFSCEVVCNGKMVKSVDPYQERILMDYPLTKKTKIDFYNLFHKDHVMIHVYKDVS